MEYTILGSVLSLLISMKFTQSKFEQSEKQMKESIERLHEELVLVDKRLTVFDKELPHKIILTTAPLTAAVKDLKTQIGV